MKHTPEPWELKHNYKPEGGCYKITKHGDYWPIIPESSSNENFSRIVACVNACAGISNEELEDVGNIRRLVTEALQAEAQRDELLAALENLIAWANIKDGSPSQQLRDDAMTAIAKAKGVNP
jgi:hypothetical protein